MTHADRAAFLVDGEAYFNAFVAAARRAQRSIYIVGWDFHSRTRLLCGEDGHCELELGDFLNDLVRRRPRLQVNILTWDYPMVFGFDREWAPIYGLGWRPRRSIHFRYDNTQPIGASHHQKVVVIDDVIAFSGGIDLTCRRWDTCAHAAHDARRAAQGTPYPPFHDLAMMVDGEAARALGDLARERWRRATHESLEPPDPRRRGWRSRIEWRSRPAPTSWPEEVRPSVANVEVAISRTEPALGGEPGVREVENLYLDMIAAARRSIYIENQYFTADKVGEALAARLAQVDGPEIVVVLRELSHGWLEELTMQTLRTRLIQKLLAADVHGRLTISYPYIAGLKEGTCIDVHAKLIIVDDDYVRIGSANLANRSMGLDTECDLTIHAAGREDIRLAVRSLRSGLLAEHLGATAEEVQDAVAETGSLRAAIDRLHRDDRTLRPLTSVPEVSATVLDIAGVADPERPVELNDLVKLFNPGESRPQSAPLWRKAAAMFAVVAALTALWQLTPLDSLLQPDRITDWAAKFGGQWWAPLIVLFAYTPACLTMFPRPLITLFAVVAFGPWLGFLYAMLGIQIAAWFTYIAGQRLNRGTVRRLAGSQLNAIIEVLRRRGLIAMTALRLVPLAPFAVEGLVAGAVHIKLWHFLLGTAIGILPGTLAATVFGGQLEALIEDRSSVNYWLIAAAVLLLAAATWFVRRWLNSSSAQATAHHGVGNARAA